MDKPPLKVGLLASGFSSGTGPASYLKTLRAAASEGIEFVDLSQDPAPEVDLVHLVDAKRASLAALEKIRAPLVADFHDDYWVRFTAYPCPDRPLRRLRQIQLRRHHVRVIRRARAVVVHSRAVEQSFRACLDDLAARQGLATPALHLVPYALSLETLAAAKNPRPKNKTAGHDPKLLLVGRDIFRKGFPVALAALPMIRAVYPGVRLAVIGEEYAHTRLWAKYLSRGLPVDFLPVQSRDRLAHWYETADALLLPSYREAFGLVLLEAMAAGLPVLASRVGGIPEAIADAGLLHNPRDPVDLAQKVLAVLGDDALRQKLVAAGQSQAQLFCISAMAARLEDVYKSVKERSR